MTWNRRFRASGTGTTPPGQAVHEDVWLCRRRSVGLSVFPARHIGRDILRPGPQAGARVARVAGNTVQRASIDTSRWSRHRAGQQAGPNILGNWFAPAYCSDMSSPPEEWSSAGALAGRPSSAIKSGVEESLRRLHATSPSTHLHPTTTMTRRVERSSTTLDGWCRRAGHEIAASRGADMQAGGRLSTRRTWPAVARLQPHYSLVSCDTFEGELSSGSSRPPGDLAARSACSPPGVRLPSPGRYPWCRRPRSGRPSTWGWH